ncbi:hypothetical protein BsWGS_25991 [Bradybaena similaris]
MLQSNKTLSRLELAGSNVPSDILKSIETAVQNNGDRQAIVDKNLKRTQTMAKHIRDMEQDKKLQLNELLTTIDRQEDLMRKSQKSSTQHIGSLQLALDERKGAFNSLAAKASEELKYLKQLSEGQDKNMQLQSKVEDLDRKCHQQQEQIYDLKEQVTHLQVELTLKGSQF